MKASRNADLFTSYCLALTTAETIETVGKIAEQFTKDDSLTETQKDALEALGNARERILQWATRSNT